MLMIDSENMGNYIQPSRDFHKAHYIDTSIDQEVEFQARGETYYLTMLRTSDSPALHAILSNPIVSDRLIRVPKP